MPKNNPSQKSKLSAPEINDAIAHITHEFHGVYRTEVLEALKKYTFSDQGAEATQRYEDSYKKIRHQQQVDTLRDAILHRFPDGDLQKALLNNLKKYDRSDRSDEAWRRYKEHAKAITHNYEERRQEITELRNHIINHYPDESKKKLQEALLARLEQYAHSDRGAEARQLYKTDYTKMINEYFKPPDDQRNNQPDKRKDKIQKWITFAEDTNKVEKVEVDSSDVRRSKIRLTQQEVDNLQKRITRYKETLEHSKTEQDKSEQDERISSP